MNKEFLFGGDDEFFVALRSFLEACAKGRLKYLATSDGRGRQSHLTVRQMICQKFNDNVARQVYRASLGHRMDRDTLEMLLDKFEAATAVRERLIELHRSHTAVRRHFADARSNRKLGTRNVNPADVPIYMERLQHEHRVDALALMDAQEFQRFAFDAIETKCLTGNAREGMRNAHALKRTLDSKKLSERFFPGISPEMRMAYSGYVIRSGGWSGKTIGDRRNFHAFLMLSSQVKIGVDREANVCASSLSFHNQVLYGPDSPERDLSLARENYRMSVSAAESAIFPHSDAHHTIASNLTRMYVEAGASAAFVVPEVGKTVANIFQQSIEKEEAFSFIGGRRTPTSNLICTHAEMALAELNDSNVSGALRWCDKGLSLLSSNPAHYEMARARCLVVKGRIIARQMGSQNNAENRQAQEIYERLGHKKLAHQISLKMAA